MQYTDGTKNSTPSMMNADDKQFLEKVMKECVIDEVELMTQIIDLLKGKPATEAFSNASSSIEKRAQAIQSDEELLEFKEDCLDDLCDRVENFDNAKAFMQIGGLKPLLDILGDANPSLRARAASVVGAISQNHPETQAALMELGALSKLTDMQDETHTACRTKSLHAISCLIRGNKHGEEQFLSDRGGVELLMRCMAATDIRLQRKSLFLFRALIFSAPCLKEDPKFNDIALVTSSLVESPDIDLREGALSAIADIITLPQIFHLLKEKKNGGVEKYRARLDKLKALKGEDAEAALEEITLVGKILHALSKEGPSVSSAEAEAVSAAGTTASDFSEESGRPVKILQLTG